MAEAEDDLSAIVHSDPRTLGDRTPIVLDCELALLGTLLRSDVVEQAASVLAAVADEDFADPWVRRAVGLCRRVVADGVVPVASVLLARLSSEQGQRQHQLMRVLLVDAWFAGPPPEAAWSLALAVLESSYRRAARCWADRVRQASDGPLDVLRQVVRDDDLVRAVWRRLVRARRTVRRVTPVPDPVPGAAARRGGSSARSVWQARPA
jgi:hypothetical protein